MADENNAGPSIKVEDADALAKAPAPKTQGAPRRQKASAETTVVSSPVTAAKVPKNRRKRRELSEEAKPTPAGTHLGGKNSRRKRMPKPTEQAVQATVPATDEMADLIQLQEENKRLRKTLADKLRAENADLRKRLGLD
ncbi:SyrB-like regulator [Rhizobium sp. 007]|uniref:SyrB-like regulator n=1 Tax=Rhizobium sp. 007 TaxID=2785056 RepID=UPI00188E849F|nr:SyrB-like regulator [Rhizobium sp. 007]QPB24624.1 SyrB-like regulator [Rhizobium sp. 007]